MSFHKPNVGSSMQINQQHHGNKVPVGGIIIKHTNPNMIPTNPIIHTTNSYQNNTQSVIGGLQQNTVRQSGIPTNQIVTSMTQTHPPPQLTNQNGIMTPSGDAAAVGNQNQAHTGDQQQDHQTEQQKSTETALANTKEKTPMCLINELARYNKVIRESGPPHMKNFVTRCTVGDIETEAEGNSKKFSKKKAAEMMLEKLKDLPPLPPSALKPKNKTVTNKKKSKNIIKVIKIIWFSVNLTWFSQMHRADPNYGVGINPISRLIQIQQAQQKKEPVYALVAERGLPRRREFVIQVTVDDETCTGVGPNKKLAKRHAAESMLNLLGYNKPSPQPTKPAIKTSSTPEKVTFMENSEESSGEMVNGKTGRQLVPGLLLLPDSSYTGGNPIYNQGIPNSLPPGALKGTDPMVFQTCPPPIRPEIQLRDIATRNNIDLKFDEFSAKGQSEFLSRASLMTNPPRVFHGSGPTIEASRDMAAMEAMKPQMKKEAEELANSSNMGGTHPGRVSAM
ncbi:hypothetical protein KUTeg_000122 [Tegillarca granosa]|uniref:DRBM domain-containing protein n=1 Tax=Tegillarca granosa TaxID=220873 RepID=A0ABQ9FWN3_TEGGR|nr:hypothetical protein KUTeg_000122 [Tegillarca granosa]